MIEFSVKPPTIPIPFHKLLKVVALVDGQDPQTRELLDHIAAEHFEIEVSDNFDRDVSEDAGVGAYIALVDGERREKARRLGAGGPRRSASGRRSGRWPIRTGLPTSPSWA